MMKIRQANADDIKLIKDLAHEIWWPTYQDFIPKAQISLMLENIYNEKALNEQFNQGHCFLILSIANNDAGFASFSDSENPKIFKLHKLYLKPNLQGKGAGTFFIRHIEAQLKSLGAQILELNVNRNNPAKTFYQKLGFKIHAEIDIPYHDFVLDDYVMRKHI